MKENKLLVLDLGGNKAVEVARKLRNLHYYCEVMPIGTDLKSIKAIDPKGIVYAGGEQTEDQTLSRAGLSVGLPVLALGGAARWLAWVIESVPTDRQLEGRPSHIVFHPCALFEGLFNGERYFERVEGYQLPAGYESIAHTVEGAVPAFAHFERNLYALQFYPESNDPDGMTMLDNFAQRICGCVPDWTMENYIELETERLRERIGNRRALLPVSGGTDSATCALLMRKAIGNQLTCVFVDTGLLREGEAELVLGRFRNTLGIEPYSIDASDRILPCLKGVTDTDDKRTVVHKEMLAILTEQLGTDIPIDGANYNDILNDPSITDDETLHPLRRLFKDEVRRVGEMLGLPELLANRQPFPEAGLAMRCLGEVTAEKLAILRRAEAIFKQEIRAAGMDKRLSRFFVILSDTLAKGKRGGKIVDEYALILRAVSNQGPSAFSVGRLPYDLLERVSMRITDEVEGIDRVTYDLTNSTHAFAEWA